jgi:hypothetical protein
MPGFLDIGRKLAWTVSRVAVFFGLSLYLLAGAGNSFGGSLIDMVELTPGLSLPENSIAFKHSFVPHKEAGAYTGLSKLESVTFMTTVIVKDGRIDGLIAYRPYFPESRFMTLQIPLIVTFGPPQSRQLDTFCTPAFSETDSLTWQDGATNLTLITNAQGSRATFGSGNIAAITGDRHVVDSFIAQSAGAMRELLQGTPELMKALVQEIGAVALKAKPYSAVSCSATEVRELEGVPLGSSAADITHTRGLTPSKDNPQAWALPLPFGLPGKLSATFEPGAGARGLDLRVELRNKLDLGKAVTYLAELKKRYGQPSHEFHRISFNSSPVPSTDDSFGGQDTYTFTWHTEGGTTFTATIAKAPDQRVVFSEELAR